MDRWAYFINGFKLPENTQENWILPGLTGLISNPQGFFCLCRLFYLGAAVFLRTEKIALGEDFFVFIHAPIVLGSSYTKIRIFLPNTLFNLQKLIQIKYACIRETET